MVEKLKVKPFKLKGEINAIASKTYAHRMIILSALSKSKSKLIIKEYNDDIMTTLQCVKDLGGDFEIKDDELLIRPIEMKRETPYLNANESGSTLRFIIPVATTLYENTFIDARGTLKNRPIKHLINALEENGVSFSGDVLPFETFGKFKGGEVSLPGNISSQYITGILLASSILKEDTIIKLTSELESKAYVDVTIEVLEDYGVHVKKLNDGFYVKGSQKLCPPKLQKVEGDWSNAAAILVAGALNGSVFVKGLNLKSSQGDKVILRALKDFGADVKVFEEGIKVSSNEKKPIEMNINECPDLLPVLSILACGAKGQSVFSGGHRLRIKESDRLTNSMELINKLGGDAKVSKDKLIVNGKGSLSGGVVEGYKDHRMVMAAALAATISEDDIEIIGCEAINKSYPGFFKDLEVLNEFNNRK